MGIMLYTTAFLLCLPGTLLAQSSPTDIVDVARPGFLTANQFYARVAEFWTPDRLRSAQLLDLKLTDSKSGRSLANDNAVPTPPLTIVPGSLPSVNGIAAGRALSNDARLLYTSGRAFWSVGGILRSCSGSVVQSNSSDLIVTAAQCVHDTKTNSTLINGNWVFVPAYQNGSAPFGIWPARRVLTLRAWTQAADLNYDVAFVALSIVKSRSIRATVGSQGIGFSQPRRALTYSVGYPLNKNHGGQYLQVCSGKAQQSPWKQNNFVGQGLSCVMGSGGAGGPWLQSVNEVTGRGVLTSLNSFTISNAPNVINGPYFGGQVLIAWSTATHM